MVNTGPTAVVTGSSKGLGRALVLSLLSQGYRVHGLARTQVDLGENYFHHQVDLLDSGAIKEFCTEILSRETTIDLVVNNAGIGYFAPHEELFHDQISDMVAINLTAPMLISRYLLRCVKKSKGTMVFITSVAAKKRSHLGAAYAGTKAGLSHFTQCLFEEVRKSEVRVFEIAPDFVKTNFFDHQRFEPVDSAATVLDPDGIAQILNMVLGQPAGTVITEMVIRPQKLGIKKR